jgi:anti-sigma factor RsiW
MDLCEMVLLVQAEFDGELDVTQAAKLQIHRAQCPACHVVEQELSQVRELLAEVPYQAVPDSVREAILAQLDATRPKSALDRATPRLLLRLPWRQPVMGFGLGAACAAALAFLVLSPAEQSLTEQVVAGHIRALQPGHLEDIASTNQHTVKPWFDGKLDFAPPVKDFVLQGFQLKGGRLDYLDAKPVAALVYQRGKHIINLFIWPDRNITWQPPTNTGRQGYNVVHWPADGMSLWAVSDVASEQLGEFAELWRHAP